MTLLLDRRQKGVYYGAMMKRRNVHLTERQIERLGLLAKKTGLAISDLIRRAIDEYLNKENKNI